MDEVAGRLADISGLLSMNIPKGEYVPFSPVEVSDSITSVDIGAPLFSCTIINDGPDDVYPLIYPITDKVTPLKKGEPLIIDFRSAKIKNIAFVCDEGCRATVRIFGVR
jgi:hypothetical protein